MYYKGIVMELNKDHAIVMINSGDMLKIKIKKGLLIGDAIIFTEEDIIKESKVIEFKNKKWIKPLALVASIFFIIIFNFSGKDKEPISNPYALVTLDINPSIGLEVDENKIVVNAKGLNKDGKKMNMKDLNGKSLDEATKIIRSYVQSNKDIKNKDSMIVGFAFLENTNNKVFEKSIQNIIRKNFSGVEIVYMYGSSQDREMAIEKGISLGRYKADEIINEDLLEDTIENMSVDELINLLKNKSTPVYLNKEIKDELEDRYEDNKDNDDSDRDYNDSNKDNDDSDRDYNDSNKYDDDKDRDYNDNNKDDEKDRDYNDNNEDDDDKDLKYKDNNKDDDKDHNYNDNDE
ncbi:anti-sigma factor domain-containing protein [Romboutsia sp. MSSM.1001216sp_RTP31141st1_G3_RTP31141_220114]|uniref:anti-sigma factor domain-containing protein n=2 Tax=unclassified Romboutsia TaxID=2626894 RepID=UPI0031B56573